MNQAPGYPQRNRVLIIIAGIAAIFLCFFMALAGFAIGRATATPQTITETLRETSEVTREVTREVEVLPAQEDVPGADDAGDVAGDSAGDSEAAELPDLPTALPTAPPAQDEVEEGNVEDVDFTVFEEVWRIIDDRYDGPVPPTDEIVYSAIEGSLQSLNDEYTRFIRPEIAALLREDMGGTVEGIGALVRENEDGFIEISSPIEGQPADLAGLLPGDLIIGVNGESVIGLSLEEVVLKVRGPAGTSVDLTIAREGVEEPLEFTIVRASFEVPIVEAEMLPDDMAYVQLTEFSVAASETLLESLNELLAQNPRGVILDLRANPGGLLSQAVAVTDIFLPEGVVLYQRDNQGVEEVFRADSGDIGESIPLVVLINPGSASASEIVAGAIKDQGRGVLIGETTFGKGSVQSVNELSDGSELRVTIARWYTPGNQSIDGAGIVPDIEVPIDPESEEDVQLQRAIDYLLNGE
ncbi:MAG TPA: S41 family peptidase [Anaerolineae bacterium]